MLYNIIDFKVIKITLTTFCYIHSNISLKLHLKLYIILQKDMTTSNCSKLKETKVKQRLMALV